MIKSLQQGFDQLSEREQRLLIIAVPVVVLLLLGLWVTSEYRRFSAIQSQYRQLQQGYAQLRLQAQPLQEWRQQAGGRSLGALASSSREAGLLLNEGLTRFQLRGNVTAESDVWQVDIQGDGNRTLGYLQAARASGLRLQDASINRTNDRGEVKAQLRFVGWVTP